MNDLAEPHRQSHGQRQEDDGQKRQPRADGQHYNDSPRHQHNQVKDTAEGILHKFTDICRIVIDTVHQLAGPPVLDKGQRQHLHLLIEAATDIHADSRSKLCAPEAAQISGDDGKHRNDSHDKRKANDLLEAAVVGHQRIIDEPLLEHRACQTYQGRKQHHQRHHHELLFIIRA